MIKRSVPGYEEIIRRQIQLSDHYYQAGTQIYDLGCSTGNLELGLCAYQPKRDFVIIAVDNSPAMIARCRERLNRAPRPERVVLSCGDIRHIQIRNASMVVLNYTLQFLPVADRLDLLKNIAAGLLPGGVLLFCEKITHSHAAMNDLQHKFYHAFKRENGYSELEISQKREALEKILIPETMETHLQRMQAAGFEPVDIWHKWFNFAAFIAFKV
jgi:tRNA (cmo5U34)-methyltransferase